MTCGNEISKFKRINSFQNKNIDNTKAIKNQQANKPTNKEKKIQQTKHMSFLIAFANKRTCFDLFLTLYVVLAYQASSKT